MKIERGVILAGGNGTRMRELSDKNKHTLDVAGFPMINYPLNTLKEMNIEKVTVVSSYDGIVQLMDVIDEPDMEIEYRLQEHPRGMADALGAAAVHESLFVVLCGDCYHSPAPKLDSSVQLWWTRQDGMNQGAIWDPEINRIVEKPKKLGGLAIIGARVYDQTAVEMVKSLRPSSRGELELVDIDNWYLQNDLQISYYGGFFGDMGTPKGLERVETHANQLLV